MRPPGALPESQFLDRCLKCGQCMRICPTNVIHPAGLEGGLEGLWTPVLNFRIGTSGCQYKCIACGNICPTAAIRPITLDERLGQNRYEGTGPIRIGMAFVDRGRCLPWAMDIPCIVCQENCPVSPKAIVTRTVFSTVATNEPLIVAEADFQKIRFRSEALIPGRLATGDYYCREEERNGSAPLRIVRQSGRRTDGDRRDFVGSAIAGRQPYRDTHPAPATLRQARTVHRLRRLRARMPCPGAAGHQGDRGKRKPPSRARDDLGGLNSVHP